DQLGASLLAPAGRHVEQLAGCQSFGTDAADSGEEVALLGPVNSLTSCSSSLASLVSAALSSFSSSAGSLIRAIKSCVPLSITAACFSARERSRDRFRPGKKS